MHIHRHTKLFLSSIILGMIGVLGVGVYILFPSFFSTEALIFQTNTTTSSAFPSPSPLSLMVLVSEEKVLTYVGLGGWGGFRKHWKKLTCRGCRAAGPTCARRTAGAVLRGPVTAPLVLLEAQERTIALLRTQLEAEANSSHK
jgi:hypothetical protein